MTPLIASQWYNSPLTACTELGQEQAEEGSRSPASSTIRVGFNRTNLKPPVKPLFTPQNLKEKRYNLIAARARRQMAQLEIEAKSITRNRRQWGSQEQLHERQ